MLERAKGRAGIERPGRSLFFHCHALAKREQVALERMNNFLNLYGFCRNVSMSAVLAVPVLGVGLVLGRSGNSAAAPWWMVGGVVAAVGMFYRYLKFSRLYAVEVFVTYAELD